MTATIDLLDQLDAAPDDERERIYSASSAALSRDDVIAAIDADRPCLSWLLFRFDAGPPGTPLPDPETALRAVLTGDGTPLDAYSLVMAGPALRADPVLKAILINAAGAAFRGGKKTWFGCWLAARAILGCIAMGEPQRAWALLDALDPGEHGHPQLDIVRPFTCIRSDPELERSPWIQGAIWWLWSGLKLPAIPRIPFPEQGDQPLDTVLEKLEQADARKLRDLVKGFATTINEIALSAHEDDPLVRDLERRALSGEGPPKIETLPEWFESWARDLGRAGRHRVAYLAGHLLHAHGGMDGKLVAALIWPLARAADLAILRAGFDEEAMLGLVDELAEATSRLSPEVADALLAHALPGHDRAKEALAVLVRARPALETLEVRPGGVVEHIVWVLGQIEADRQAEHAEVWPVAEALWRAVHQAVALLGDPRQLTSNEVERAVAGVPAPAVSLALLELSQDAELPPLKRLLQALILLRAVQGTELEPTWAQALRNDASQALWRLGVIGLFDLRIRLLDALIEDPDPHLSLAELHFQRANSRRALRHEAPDSTRLVLEDLHAAIAIARRVGEADELADAVALLAKVTAELGDRGGDIALLPDLGEVEAQIDEALSLRVHPQSRAMLLHAKAHLCRKKAPAEAAEHLSRGMDQLPAEDPFRWELGAERVQALLEAGLPSDAVAAGRALLGVVSERATDTVIAMVHHSLGLALIATGEHDEARVQLEAALERTRGVDPRNETSIRTQLAQLGLRTLDQQLWRRHFDWLTEHWSSLDHVAKQDVARLAVVSALRGFAEATAALGLLDDTIREARRAGPTPLLDLERARLTLAIGEDTALRAVVEAALDHDSSEIRDLVFELAFNHGDQLDDDTLRKVADRARKHDRPSVFARMLAHVGQDEEACAVLRQALDSETGGERIACLHLLVTLLPMEERTERLERCGDLEEALDAGQDDAAIRLDLASGLRLVARGDLGILKRARHHAKRAMSSVRDPEHVAHSHRVLAQVIADSVHASMAHSTADLAEQARWLLGEHPLPDGELARIRHAVAHYLLVFGPLCHPAAADVAEQLITLAAEALPDDEGIAAVVRRCRWVRARLAGEGTPEDRGTTSIQGPADQCPDWLVAHVAGRKARLQGSDVEGGLDAVAIAIQVRPDAADRVLAGLVAIQGDLSPGTRTELFELARQSVARLGFGPKAWCELERVLTSIKKKKLRSTIRGLEQEIQRSRGLVTKGDEARETRGTGRGTVERATACYDQAIELMHIVHHESVDPRSLDLIQRARALLEEAVDIAKRKKLPHLASFQISLGNAWKMPPEEDIEHALAIYERVSRERLPPDQRAQLWKVQGDALRHRGRPEDLRKAFELLVRSADARTGAWRAASLNSAAMVARSHPDFDELQQVVRPVELLVQATRADAQTFDQEGDLRMLLDLLGEWRRLKPRDSRPRQIREELRGRYPHRIEEIDRPACLPPREMAEQVFALMSHPASMAYITIAGRLMSPAQRSIDPHGIKQRFGPAAAADQEAEMARESLHGDANSIERVLQELDSTPHEPDAEPGLALARLRLLAELLRLGRGDLARVREAAASATPLLEGIPDTAVRAFLICQLATIWSPHDHLDDPVTDFGLAVDLARQSLAIEGGEISACTDTIGLLARSLRYSPRGDLRANLAESRRLYRLLVDRAQQDGDGDLASNALHCLADIETQIGEGDRLARLRAGEHLIEQAVQMARSLYKEAEYTSSLAWQQTQIANQLPGEEAVEGLRKAASTFDSVDERHLDATWVRNHRLNRDVCLTSLARLTEGRQAKIQDCRTQLAAAEESGPPYHRATIQHNLAGALLDGDAISPADLAEGIRLCERASSVRTLEANPRHHWETALIAGRAIAVSLVAPGAASPLVAPSSDATASWKEARTWLQRAVEAARILGPGEELAMAALTMAMLARTARSTQDAIDVAEEAWQAMDQAAPFLLLHSGVARAEAESALQIALVSAWRLANEGVQVVADGIAFVMEGARADTVLRWLLRGFAPVRRPLLARLARPEGVPLDCWMRWQTALASRDPLALVEPLQQVRMHAPAFLSGDVDLTQTWRWLEVRPGAVAVTVVQAQPLSLALVLSTDARGGRRVRVLGLPASPPPHDERSFADALSEATSARSAAPDVHKRMAFWARSEIVEPVLRYLEAPPSAVLWCPGQGLRLVSPAALWGAIPVATTASPALPDLAASPARPRSTLLVLADPAADALDLRRQGLAALARLRVAAKERGPAAVLASVGGAFGRSLTTEGAEGVVIDRPADPEQFLEAARDHDVIVVIAHGEAPTPESASLLLLDGQGQVQRLDVPMIAANPGRFAGATIILLACESGRVGGAYHEPGGIAGALVSAGARAVVAPLWEIRLDSAQAVAETLLRGLVEGRDVIDVLARDPASGDGFGVTLGPAPPLSVQRDLAELQRTAFVSWAG